MNNTTLSTDKTYSIDELYDRVKDYDLVLTIDAPLTDALNARRNNPCLGHFAITPRRLVMDNTDVKIEDQRSMFLNIIRKTDLNWKQASYLIENIIHCWKYTGDPYKILDYDEFESKETLEVINRLKNSSNPYSMMDDYKIEDKKVAVVSEHQFTELDRKLLPDDYDSIDIFKEENKRLPKFRIFDSSTQIIQTVLENVKEQDPKNTAVVMEPDSSYRYLIESTFRTNDIPYMISREFAEDIDLRTFLKIIRFGLSNRGLKVRDVRPILNNFNITVSREYNDMLINNLEIDELTDVKRLLNSIPDSTFKDILKIYEKKTGKKQRYLFQVLKELDILKDEISIELLNSLRYFLDSFDLTVESAGRGVLIASPKTSSYIDRPIVFYLGMDSSWTPEVPNKPWIDQDDFEEKKTKDFKILLQNGEEQYFLVQNKRMNERVVPCYYFNDFTKEDIEGFTDLIHEKYSHSRGESRSPFGKESLDVKTNPVELLSQSSLNKLAYCPKDYFFSRLVEKEDKIYFRKGNLLHDFAEFYVNHEDFVDKREKEEFVNIMMDDIRPYLQDYQESMTRTEFTIGIRNLKDYLKNKDIVFTEFTGYDKIDKRNIFAEKFDLPLDTTVTEMSFRNEDIGAKGKIDLILSENHILDHKTGRKISIPQIMKKSDIEDIADRPSFQAKMYLSHHRNKYPDKKLKFTFFHLLENLDDVISGSSSLEDNIVTVNYYPDSFNNLINKKEFFEKLKSSKNRKKVLNKLGYDNYNSFFKQNDIPKCDKNEVLKKKITQQFILFSKDIIGDYKYVEKACESIMRRLIDIRNNNYFKNDLDEFEVFLQEQIQKLNEYRNTEFPVGDVDIEYIDFKDLVIT